jgi:transposase
MATHKGKVRFEIVYGKNGQGYGLFRRSFREGKRVLHETVARLPLMTNNELLAIKTALSGQNIAPDTFKIISSREYGASAAFFELAQNINLDKLIYSNSNVEWVKSAMAMVIGQIVYPGSKLNLSKVEEYSALWEICGIEKPDLDRNCYNVLDELLKRQDAIQKRLAKKHLSDGVVVLYDITSSYLEGKYDNSEIVAHGYNRDKKRGKAQIVIGLLCTKEGCPFAVEVFKGNTNDATTIPGKLAEIQEKYRISDFIFVGDRGMLTKGNLEKCDVKTITALTHPAMKALVDDNEAVQLSLFDTEIINEVTLDGVRYCLMKNPVRGEKETKKRLALIAKTEEWLAKIAEPKRKKDDKKLSENLGAVKNKWSAAKYLHCEVLDGRIKYSRNQEKIDADALFDGLYVIRTDVSKEIMTSEEVVETYRSLENVEQAFRNFKSALLEMRPIYLHTDAHIRGHVFVCMLSYYLAWHFVRLLRPLIDSDSKTYTREYIIEVLKSWRLNKVEINSITSEMKSEQTEEQLKITRLLQDGR